MPLGLVQVNELRAECVPICNHRRANSMQFWAQKSDSGGWNADVFWVHETEHSDTTSRSSGKFRRAAQASRTPILAGRCSTGSPLRWRLRLCGPLDRRLLPPVMPVAPASTRAGRILPNTRSRGERGVSALCSLRSAKCARNGRIALNQAGVPADGARLR
jgi:hypothetical protein